jgi:hypothetical protein
LCRTAYFRRVTQLPKQQLIGLPAVEIYQSARVNARWQLNVTDIYLCPWSVPVQGFLLAPENDVAGLPLSPPPSTPLWIRHRVMRFRTFCSEVTCRSASITVHRRQTRAGWLVFEL